MGTLKVYDLMLGINSPVSIFRIGEKRLTAIAYGNEEHLTIGDYDGKIYLLSFSEAFTAINKLEQRMNNVCEKHCQRDQYIIANAFWKIRENCIRNLISPTLCQKIIQMMIIIIQYIIH